MSKKKPPRTVNVWTVAIVAAAAALGAAAFAAREPVVDERRVTSRPAQISEGGYVSSGTCRACHPSQYETWRDSFHRTMTQVAAPETVLADFDGRSVDAVQGRPMRLERRGGQFWADFDDPDWNGRGAPRRLQRQVVMMTGSHQQQVYWYQTDRQGQLGQLPATYVIRDQRWVPREMVFLRPAAVVPPSATGRWDNICIHCHTTHGKSPNVDSAALPSAIATATSTPAGASRAAEFGIACEACHGPSDGHAAANHNPIRRYWLHLTGRADPTTVQPVRLDPKISSQVCGQCHGVWFYDDRTKGMPASVATLLYKPGDDIHRTRFLTRPSLDNDSATLRHIKDAYPDYLRNVFWPDGMIRVSGREFNGLVDSPCFARASDPQRTLSCFSCHTMHKTPDDPRSIAHWADTHQVSPGKESNEACLQCHEPIRAKLASHTRHQAASSGSSCYNCHMPYTTYGLLRALRSHQISTPTVVESVETGRPNACNACHLDKSLGWTALKLEEWYGRPQPALNDDERSIAASVVWMLRGDAGQRALMAWAMGWKPAQEASGTDWMPAYLSGLLDDGYPAIRLIAYRSLRTLQGFETTSDNAVAAQAARNADIVKVLELWRARQRTARRTDASLLLKPDGSFDMTAVQRLLLMRDNRPVALNE